MKFIAALFISSVAIVGTAQAADYGLAPSPGMSGTAHDWTGLYAGVMAGYASGNVAYTDPAGLFVPIDVGIAGGLFGATVGFNSQWDMLVLGVEADLAWVNSGGAVIEPGLGTISSTNNWLGTLRARTGVAVDDLLLFATAGLAAGGITRELELVAGGLHTHSDAQVGWTLGVGAEFAVTEDISIKAEYAYTDLGTKTIPSLAWFPAPGEIDSHPTFHAVKVGANFRF